MDIEEVLNLLDKKVMAKRGEALNSQETEIIKRTWDDETYEEMNIQGYSTGYIERKISPDLWKLLSDIMGEKVTKKNFKMVLEPFIKKQNYPSLFLKAPQRQDWGNVPDISLFYDRVSELETLEKWIITEHCRLVALWGMTGIGKTALSVKLAQKLQDKFQYVIWRSLHDAPPLTEIINDLLTFFSNEVDPILPDNLGSSISALMDCLQNYRCLIILDGIENILETGQLAGRYQENYQDYGRVFKLIGEVNHQSCLLLTSAEKSQEIAILEGKTRPVRSHKVKGLSKNAAKELLREKELFEEPAWGIFIERYEGNPLYLNMVAPIIIDLFDGKVSEFVRQNTTVLDGIKDILEEHFTRLSPLEFNLVYQLANTVYPLSIEELQEKIPSPVSRSQLMEALKSLNWRSLLENRTENKCRLFTLQSVVKKYIINRFDPKFNRWK
jgi:SpoVK/Ycf46/Vps4 family AAA+-type ATPase